jgi:integrase
MGNPDDIHGFEKGYSAALKRLRQADISDRNRELIRSFVKGGEKKGNRVSTYTNDLNIALRMAQFFKKDLDTITEMDFDDLIDHLKEKGMVDYNYRKMTKKFFRWLKDDDVPKWVKKIHMPHNDTPVQPGDLPVKEELDKLLNACTHPRDKALIAVAFDSMMRIGALGTLRVKSPVFNEYGTVLYMSGTSKNLKTTTPRPVPLTWSTGFLNQWLSIHPCKDDPEAPLWVNIRGRDKNKAMSYNTLRKTLKSITERSGVKKRIFFHLFRHMKVTDMLLKGFPTQQIEYQAGWAPGSGRMLKIYGNFTGEDMVKSIFAQHGLKVEDKKVTLDRCPRCHIVLMPEAKACHQCALILDAGLSKEKELVEDKMQRALLKMMENSEVRAMFKEIIDKPE